MALANGGATHFRGPTGQVSGQWERLPTLGGSRHEAGNADEFLGAQGLDTVQYAYKAGLGILVSKTSDGGAMSVTVYDGERRFREYAGNADEADRLWEGIWAYAKSKMPGGTASPLQAAPEPVQPKNKVRERRPQRLKEAGPRERH